MILFRSLALGLLGSCVLLLAMRPRSEVYLVREPPPSMRALPITTVNATNASIIDVAPAVPAAQLTSLLHLGLDEHVIAVDDMPVHDDLEAGSRIAQLVPAPNRFVDLTVAGNAGVHRVLVLLH